MAVASPASNSQRAVMVLTVDGVINPVVGDYVKEAIQEAEKRNAASVLIELNTPGGLLDSTRSAITAMINSDIPVIVYVTPRGSRATSAGVFITMAGDIAVMAPETHIGAAHPVTITGEGTRPEKNDKPSEKKRPTPVMEEKMVSDAAAYIRTLAQERGRNADWAEKAVRESVSLTSHEALKQKVIEIVADSREDLLKQIDGREITKNKKTIKLDLKNAPIELYPMSRIQKFLHMLAHPNVAYILMMLGIYGLIYEFAAPGIGLGGAIGGVCLLLAFYSLQVLPVNSAGAILIIFGIGCLIVELLTPTHGLLTLGGLIAFGIGSFMLIDVPRDLSIPRVSATLILPTILSTGLFFGFGLKKAFAARKGHPAVGSEALLGTIGEVRKPVNPEGMVFLSGELWQAESNEKLTVGDKAIVIGHTGNKLTVKKITN